MTVLACLRTRRPSTSRTRGYAAPANAQFKTWKILRRIRGCPHHATLLVNAVQTLIHAG